MIRSPDRRGGGREPQGEDGAAGGDFGRGGGPAVLGGDFSGNASVLETYISYLRHKVDDTDPPLIHTVRGVGYSLRLPPDR